MTATRTGPPSDDFLSERHVYEPHRAGLPRLRPYFRELWRRRPFATELAKTQMRAASTDTVFGQLWLVINPLLLASVYFLLVSVLTSQGGGSTDEGYFATLTSGLFLFTFVTGALQAGTTSVIAGGRLILNTPFPKMLLTVSTVYLAFRRYLPTIPVYLVIHIAMGLPWGFHMLWMLVILFLAIVLALGLANLFATLQVYFRDTASFLPYFTRIWLYLSPVLWTVDLVNPTRAEELLLRFSWFNPAFGILAAQGQVLVEGRSPSPIFLAQGAVWAGVILFVGSLVFMSREREFAVRL